MADLRFLLLTVCLAVAACDDPAPPLEAEIDWLAGELRVANTSQTDWQDCAMVLNDNFKAELPDVAAGGRANQWLASFVDDDGQRFDLVHMQPQSLYLRCDRAPEEPGWISTGFTD